MPNQVHQAENHDQQHQMQPLKHQHHQLDIRQIHHTKYQLIHTEGRHQIIMPTDQFHSIQAQMD